MCRRVDGDLWRTTWLCRKCGRWQILDDQELRPGDDDYERLRWRRWKKRLKPDAARPYTFKCGCDSYHPLRKGVEESAPITGCGNAFKVLVAIPPCDRDGGRLRVLPVA